MPETRTPRKTPPAAQVLILGGGVSGCTVALQLAAAGVPVALVEKAGAIGGRARGYGCKATSDCQNCGVCLIGGLFEKVERHPLVEVLTGSEIWDIRGGMRDYTAVVRTKAGTRKFSKLFSIVVATGFEGISAELSAHLQIENSENAPGRLLPGSELEQILGTRSEHTLFETPPESVAFIGCFGSRDTHEDSFYCSRVCCAYTTRAAKLIKQYYPHCRVSYFFMEIQAVSGGKWLAELAKLGVEFIQSRPAKIVAGDPCALTYDDPEAGFTTREYDLVVLSEGIHPPEENAHLAEIIGLSQDAHGFLDAGPDAVATGLFVAGCARFPMRIEEAHADGGRVAREILAALNRSGGQSI